MCITGSILSGSKFNWHTAVTDGILLERRTDRSFCHSVRRTIGTPTINICVSPFFVDMGDELWIYYTGSRNPARGYDEWQHRIGLAIMPRDRFVSIDALENGGGLTIRPLDSTGHVLHLNANAVGGEIRVAVLVPNDQEVPGLALADCLPITEDSLDHQVAWKHGRALNPNQHGRLRLRFVLQQAALFSFWIE